MPGAAVQLCTLSWLGYVPDDVAAAPAAVVARLSDRLGILLYVITAEATNMGLGAMAESCGVPLHAPGPAPAAEQDW